MQWEHQICGISTIMFKECYCGPMSKVMQSVNSAKLCSHVGYSVWRLIWWSYDGNRLGRKIQDVGIGPNGLFA